MTNLGALVSIAVLALAGAVAAQPAHAATNPTMTACFEQWQQAKDVGTAPKGELWADYYKKCTVRMKESAEADKKLSTAPAKKVRKPAPITDKAATEIPPEPTEASRNSPLHTRDASGKPLSKSEIALHRRIKKCGMEWHLEHQTGELPAGETWPQFWSACNMRLKKEGLRG